MPDQPIDLAGSRVLVTSGDARAAATVRSLLDAGAEVSVAAPQLVASLQDLAERGLLTWLDREASIEDVHRADLVITGRRERARPSAAPAATGRATLVGAGPGDPGLITAAGLSALSAADVVVTDRLVPYGLLAGLDAEIVDVGKIPHGRSTSQERINAIIVETARSGRHVVRLKGGDGFVLGRGGEEVAACREAGIDVDVIPGVTSAVAVPALAGIPVTHRGVAQGFAVVSGHVPPGHPDSDVDWTALARSGLTIVVLMGVRTLPLIAQALIEAGLAAGTPAAVIADGGLPSQREARAALDQIAQTADQAGLGAPAVTVIGEVAGLTERS